MRRSSRLILLLGVFLAIVAFVGIIQLLNNAANSGPVVTEGPAVYATKEIPFGGLVTADAVELRTVPLTQRDPAAIADPGLVVGRTVTTNVVAGKQLLESDFTVAAGAGSIAQNLPAGLRAVAVSVDAISGLGNLIQAGDHVDVIVAFSKQNFVFQTGATTPVQPMIDSQATSVKTLIEGLQVIGLVLPTAGGTDPGASAAPVPAATSQIVILAATPDQAEVIKFAQLEGTLSLALRSPKDYVDANGKPVVPTNSRTRGVVLKSLLDDYGVLVPELIPVTGAR